MKPSVWVNTIAWGLLLLNNLALLAAAVVGHHVPEWPTIFLLVIPAYVLLLPVAAHIGRWHWSPFYAGVSLALWLPSFLYCIQFWSPGQGG